MERGTTLVRKGRHLEWARLSFSGDCHCSLKAQNVAHQTHPLLEKLSPIRDDQRFSQPAIMRRSQS